MAGAMKLPRALPAGLSRLRRPSSALDALPQLLTVLAAAAIAGQLALLIWKFVPGARRPPPPLPVPAQGARSDLAGLLRAPLFGSPAAVAASGENAPRTRVALVLTGTLAVRDPKAGLAIIGETAQTARLYVAGSSLPGGVRLHEVYTDRVVLDRDGALETLPMPRPATGGAAGAAARVSPPGNTEPSMGDNVQRLVAQGPEVIGEVLRPMPMYANGQLKGFRVYAGRDRQKFAKLGLQPGDLVTQINGVPLGDAQHGMEILKTLGNAATANVTIERGGAVQQLSIDTAQVAAMAESANAPARAPAAAGAPPADAPPPDAPPAAEPPPKPN
jgi:general secretion pathway protein C